MALLKQYQSDVEAILARRHDNGGDFWATPDRRLGKGSPFSTIDCVLMLSELGMDISEPVMKKAAELILSSWREGILGYSVAIWGYTTSPSGEAAAQLRQAAEEYVNYLGR
jgi:hypothetical protein